MTALIWRWLFIIIYEKLTNSLLNCKLIENIQENTLKKSNGDSMKTDSISCNYNMNDAMKLDIGIMHSYELIFHGWKNEFN